MNSEIAEALQKFEQRLQKIVYNSEIPFPSCREFPHQEILQYFSGIASAMSNLVQQQQSSNQSFKEKLAQQNKQLKEA